MICTGLPRTAEDCVLTVGQNQADAEAIGSLCIFGFHHCSLPEDSNVVPFLGVLRFSG